MFWNVKISGHAEGRELRAGRWRGISVPGWLDASTDRRIDHLVYLHSYTEEEIALVEG